jgi:hypothetical protein
VLPQDPECSEAPQLATTLCYRLQNWIPKATWGTLEAGALGGN